jgi:hypothetical protein
VSDRELASTLGRAAQAHVDRNFSAREVVPRIEGVYRDAVADHA